MAAVQSMLALLLAGSVGLQAASPRSLASSSGSQNTKPKAGSTTKSNQYKCLCVFDFDLTLRVVSPDGLNLDMPAQDGHAVVTNCKALGCGIGIASANSHQDKMSKVLKRVDADTFTDTFINSSAFQNGMKDKSIELTAIMKQYQLDSTCTVLFDDTLHNKIYSDQVGVLFELVDRTDGVTCDNLGHAMTKFHAAGCIKQDMQLQGCSKRNSSFSPISSSSGGNQSPRGSSSTSSNPVEEDRLDNGTDPGVNLKASKPSSVATSKSGNTTHTSSSSSSSSSGGSSKANSKDPVKTTTTGSRSSSSGGSSSSSNGSSSKGSPSAAQSTGTGKTRNATKVGNSNGSKSTTKRDKLQESQDGSITAGSSSSISSSKGQDKDHVTKISSTKDNSLRVDLENGS